MARLSSIFGSKDRAFFDLFEEAAGNAVRAADLLEQMLRDWPDTRGLLREIVACEHDGDRITHEIIRRIHTASATPIDGKDILGLASALDDVVDLTEEVADMFGLYRIEAPMEQAQQLADILLQACRQLAAAMPRLREFRDISHFTVEVNRLENDGDRISRDAVASLFDGGVDPMVVIRWKDIFAGLEAAIDATEHVANLLEGVMIKHT